MRPSCLISNSKKSRWSALLAKVAWRLLGTVTMVMPSISLALLLCLRQLPLVTDVSFSSLSYSSKLLLSAHETS
jgi:hypothetical protein